MLPGRRLAVIDRDGSNERVLGQWDYDAISHAWTADLQALIVSMSGMGHAEFWLYPLDGQPYILHRGVAMIGRLSGVRNGRIAAEVPKLTTNLALPPAEKGGVFRVIDSAAGETGRPVYRADGTAAFVSDRSGEAAIWTGPCRRRGAATAQRRRTTLRRSRVVAGRYEACRPCHEWRQRGRRRDRCRGYPARDLTTPEARDINRPAWTEDGKALIIPAFDTGGGWRLWRAELDGSRAVSPASSYGWRAILINGSAIFQIQSGVAGRRMDGGMRRLTSQPYPYFPAPHGSRRRSHPLSGLYETTSPCHGPTDRGRPAQRRGRGFRALRRHSASIRVRGRLYTFAGVEAEGDIAP